MTPLPSALPDDFPHGIDAINPDCFCPFHQRQFVRLISAGPASTAQCTSPSWEVNRTDLDALSRIWSLRVRLDGALLSVFRMVDPREPAGGRVGYSAVLGTQVLERINASDKGDDERRVIVWRMPGPCADPEYPPRLVVDDFAWWWRPELEPYCWR